MTALTYKTMLSIKAVPDNVIFEVPYLDSKRQFFQELHGESKNYIGLRNMSRVKKIIPTEMSYFITRTVEHF